MKPIIGITCNYDPLDTVGKASNMGTDGQDWNYVAGDYVYAIEEAGGIPVILPRCKDMTVLEPLLDRLDGVLMSGGHDVNPLSYGEWIRGCCGRVIQERDVMDLSILRYAYETKKPILAICRGTQILNAAMGGTIYQDLEKDGGFEEHAMDTSARQYPVHRVELETDSILHRIFGRKLVPVNSYHHQAVKQLGKNVTVTARSEDGVVEGIEVSGGADFVVGVQWHPEMMYTSDEQKLLFRAFVAACE
ncbi:MAG: gamma-glutamyl-gamma-aminobutyrate hydrolase family protein [Firmicutes bacterium]|nr:gamma-glutamyl-gamma-aminobutyrate hydrolase family protein [Bacillota bacterium]